MVKITVNVCHDVLYWWLMHTKKSKLFVILLCLLFISLAYNVWWVGFERSSTEETIEELNTYIEMSRDVLVSLNKVTKSTTDYANDATDALIRCADGDLSGAEETAKNLNDQLKEIKLLEEETKDLIRKRTEFANASGNTVTYLDEEKEAITE